MSQALHVAAALGLADLLAERPESTDDLVAACDGDARVLLIERDLADPAASWLDLQMLVMLSGRERTEDEYAALFRAAGLEPAGTTPIGAGLRVFEARRQ